MAFLECYSDLESCPEDVYEDEIALPDFWGGPRHPEKLVSLRLLKSQSDDRLILIQSDFQQRFEKQSNYRETAWIYQYSKWTKAARFEAVIDRNACVIGDKLFILGGKKFESLQDFNQFGKINESGELQNGVMIIDLKRGTEQLQEAQNSPETQTVYHYIEDPLLKRKDHSVCQISFNEILIIGGSDGHAELKDAVVFNIDTLTSRKVLESDEICAGEMRYLKEGRVIMHEFDDKMVKYTLRGDQCTYEFLESLRE